MDTSDVVDVAIIGAGTAGLTAARELARAGRDVVVFDKSRGLGGRVATRRYHEQPVDHGAPHLRVRNARLLQDVERWLPHLRTFTETHRVSADSTLVAERLDPPAYAFVDGMNTLGKLLAEDVNVVRETTIETITPEGEGWGLEPSSGPPRYARHLVVNLPAEQALALCDGFKLGHDTAIALKNVRFERCLSVMAGYDAPAPAWYRLRCDDHPELREHLSVLYHNSAKRAEPSETTVVLHSSPGFADSHYSADRDEVARLLLRSAATISPWLGTPTWHAVQRWRYARVRVPYPERVLTHTPTLHFCGDWCGQDDPEYGVEAAYLSGLAAANTLLG